MLESSCGRWCGRAQVSSEGPRWKAVRYKVAPQKVIRQMRVKGRLVRKRLNRGSKSEHWGFVLETPDGAQMAVEKRDDNPFEQRSLEPLKDRRVEALGEMYRGRLLVDAIHRID